MQQVGILSSQNLSVRLKSQFPKMSFLLLFPNIDINLFFTITTSQKNTIGKIQQKIISISLMFNIVSQSSFLIYNLEIIQINMLGYIAIVLFLHATLSTLRWRKFVQVNQEPFFLPIDITLEIIVATVLALISILAHTKKFKAIKQFTQSISYDASFFKGNFKNYRTSRASLLLPYIKQRLGSQDLSLQLKL